MTLTSAFEIALAMELATKSCAELQSTVMQGLDRETSSTVQPVHRLQGKPGSDKSLECFRSGSHHMATA